MKYLVLVCAISVLVACGEDEKPKENVAESTTEEVLTEVKDGVFTQYYPGRKKIKFRGPQDPEGRRHGIWYFYDEAGHQISMTDFKHGLKNGVSLKKFPNGMIHYTGEYEDDKQVGIWKTYDETGKLVDSTKYTELNKMLN